MHIQRKAAYMNNNKISIHVGGLHDDHHREDL
jgi:hypothetical protein